MTRLPHVLLSSPLPAAASGRPVPQSQADAAERWFGQADLAPTLAPGA